MIDPYPNEEPDIFKQVKYLKLEDVDEGEIWVYKLWLTRKFALVAYDKEGVKYTEAVDPEYIIDMM